MAASSSLFTLVNVDCKLPLMFCKPATMLMLTMAAIKAYSMAVAPDSSSRKRGKVVIGTRPSCDEYRAVDEYALTVQVRKC